MSGFITLDRAAFDHPLLKDGDRFRAWFWMVSRACWTPTPFDINGRIIMLERGQFCCSIRELAETWKWSKSSVERFLTRLKTGAMVRTDSGTGRLVITICNYAKYQDAADKGGTATGTPTGTAAGQQRDTKEQGNKETKKKEKNSAAKNVDIPKDVLEKTWADFLDLRKAKNAPISETALSGIRREAEKAGWSMQNALAECCERGWQGFKAEWVKKGNVNSFPATGNDPLVDIILARKAREDAKKALNPPPNSPPSAIPSQGSEPFA